jgi:hypothetical protein
LGTLDGGKPCIDLEGSSAVELLGDEWEVDRERIAHSEASAEVLVPAYLTNVRAYQGCPRDPEGRMYGADVLSE